jgi:hypothetical protein
VTAARHRVDAFLEMLVADAPFPERILKTAHSGFLIYLPIVRHNVCRKMIELPPRFIP